MNSPQADDAAVQSLIDAVTEGGGDELVALHRTAAAAHTALQSAQPIEPAPDRLRERLRADAEKFAVAPKSKIVRLDFSRAGWLAAAACLVLSCFLWVRQTGPSPALANAGLEQVLAAPDLIRVAFDKGKRGDSAAAPTGEVVWSTSLQRGFLRLKGLAVNQPAQHQYQLWIVDPLRDPTFPVDGGVFDVKGDEALIPIQAKLGIYSPRAFVITSEQPGGIVKSRAEKPVLLASVN